MRATRITIEVKDTQGNWFKAFQMPFDGADELRLPNDASARIADMVQKQILAELGNGRANPPRSR